MKTVTIENREIALMALDKLCKENNTNAALRLAGCMLKYSYISMGVGDIDWEIDMAIQQCGGSQEPAIDILLHSTLMGKRIWKNGNIRKYEKNYTENNHTEGGHKVAFVIYNSMYGKWKPAVHR